MKAEDMFSTNNIDDVITCILKEVNNGQTLFTMFPVYNPKLGIGEEYSIVGKKENHTFIVNTLKEKNVGVKKIVDSFYVFFPASLSEEQQKDIEREAISLAHMYDIID